MEFHVLPFVLSGFPAYSMASCLIQMNMQVGGLAMLNCPQVLLCECMVPMIEWRTQDRLWNHHNPDQDKDLEPIKSHCMQVWN